MSSKNNIPLAKQEVRRNRSTASTVLSDSTAHRIEEGIILSPPTSSSLSSDSNEASPSTAKSPSSDCPSRKIIITVLLLSTLAIIVGVVSIYATSNKDSSAAESQQEDYPTVANDDSTSVELLEDATVDYDTAIDDVSEETGEVIIPTADNSNPSSPLFFDPSPDNDESMNDQDNNMLLIDTTSSPSLSPITGPPSTVSPTTFNPTSASPTSASPTSASPTEEPIIYDAIIIGAGWSGLRAAKVLSDSGANVLILEANDYIGGRSKTIMTKNNIPTDLGSEWLYANWNTKAPELKNAGLLGRATENDLNTVVHGEGSLYYSQLVVNDDEEDGETGGGKAAMLIEDGYKIQSSLWKEFMNYKKEILKDQDDISYQDLLDMFLIVNSFSNEEEQLLHLLFDMGETEYSGEVDEMSVKELPFWFMEGGEMEDAYYMAVPDVGFGNTAVAYADGIDAEFKLNSKVSDVNYEDDNDDNVIISYEENGRTRKAEAKTALVTASLGVLQAETISFTPKLPDSKTNAIDNMGFGDMNKIVLYWESEEAIVWPDEYWFELITPEDETSGMFTTWYNPTSLKGVPCLVGWISGDEAESIEIETDEVIKEKAMDHLKSMFPSISEPDTVIISRWGQEEHVRGAYSFSKVGRNFADDAETLKEPVGNVWFGGEAMGGEWHATTVGAWQSGEEAADDMISSVLKKRF